MKSERDGAGSRLGEFRTHGQLDHLLCAAPTRLTRCAMRESAACQSAMPAHEFGAVDRGTEKKGRQFPDFPPRELPGRFQLVNVVWGVGGGAGESVSRSQLSLYMLSRALKEPKDCQHRFRESRILHSSNIHDLRKRSRRQTQPFVCSSMFLGFCGLGSDQEPIEERCQLGQLLGKAAVVRFAAEVLGWSMAWGFGQQWTGGRLVSYVGREERNCAQL
ncbi:hypothetical protein B0T19DRAFT_80138 [Cercophora scortea]|uniref:Uncharacterized protein n=1 Tax=Cercophora scortea TaxID=314031 RepID=A0AAE0MM70_9PEZI|nr:hypothetical protein B0T19DRAFT_80138 [Cercophora scortea]